MSIILPLRWYDASMLRALALSSACLVLSAIAPPGAAYVQAVDAWHAQRTARLAAEDGWLSLVGLDWLQPGENTLGTAPGSTVLLPAGTIVYLFLFKMMSFMQSRLGPMEAGPHGQLQLLAEVGKSIQKEDITPTLADEKLFKLAPYLIVASVLLVYVVVPFGPDAYFTNLDVGIFYALAHPAAGF